MQNTAEMQKTGNSFRIRDLRFFEVDFLTQLHADIVILLIKPLTWVLTPVYQA